MKIRNLVKEDLPSLVKLLNEAYRASYEFIPFKLEKLRARIQESHLEISVAEEDGGIEGSVAYVDGHWGEEIEWLCVLECPHRKHLEDVLVREIEKHVKGDAVFTVLDSESPKIGEWFQRGYKPEGGLYHMVARIDGLKPIPQVPEGVVIRSLKPSEEKELIEAVNAGFGWERLKLGVVQRWKSEYPSFSEEWVHVAVLNGRTVSVVVSKPDIKYNKFFNGRRGYLGPATTLPEYRGRNLASALTRRAMNSLFEKGIDSVALYTVEQNVASVTLLKKLSFEIVHRWRFMCKHLVKSKEG
jgi:ribosomal protein S18 acetylase RimI-like enzyme